MKQLPGRARAARALIPCLLGTILSALAAGKARATVQATGTMTTPRSQHTATFLGTGRVLVAGGTNQTGRLATAELFDPATGAFTPTGSMPEARSGHTATVLRSGKVLVVGGDGDSGTLASCRLYDPRTGTWTTTGSLGTPRRAHTATLLGNALVLVAAGQNGNTPLSSAEVYDPIAGTWSAAGTVGVARYAHAAVLLPDGKVLVAGGQSQWIPALYTPTASLFNPATGAWTATDSLATSRRSFTLTQIPGGLVVAAGGQNSSGHLSSAERYNVSTGTWGSAGDIGAVRSGHAAALLPDARILLAGGRNADGPVGAVAEYDPAANTWSSVETGPARYDHAATLLPGGRLLLAGGVDYGSWHDDAELVDRASPSWSGAGTTWGRADGTATLLPNGKVLVLGRVASGDGTRGALYDPGTGTWASTAGTMKVPRSKHTATLLPDGSVLVVGGVDVNGTLVTKDEVYVPGSDVFAELANPLPTRRAEHAAVLLPDGRVLVAGGQSGSLLVPAIYSGGFWTEVAGDPGIAGSRTRLTLLANGQVLVTSDDADPYVFDASPGPRGGWRPAAPADSFPGEPVLLPSGDVLVCRANMEFSLLDLESGTVTSPFPQADLPVRAVRGYRATVLPDGRVLLTGGYGGATGTEPLALAAVLDPATGLTTALPSMSTARTDHAVTLLPSGRVLVAGGRAGTATTVVPTAETLRLWPGLAESSRPVLGAWPSSLTLPDTFSLGGTGFLGIGEATGGNGALASSVGFPAVLLQRIEGGFSRWVLPAATGGFSSTAFLSDEVSGIPGGHYLVTLFASGIPSASKVFPVTACELWAGVMESTSAASVCAGQTLLLKSKVVSSGVYRWTLPDASTSSEAWLSVPNAQPEDGGIYTVVGIQNGCTSPPDSVLVRVAPVESTVIDAPDEVRGALSYEASVPWRLGSSWEWSLSEGLVTKGAGTNRITFTATVGGPMTISVVEEVGATCRQPEAQKTVVVGPGLNTFATDPIVVGASNTFTGGGFTAGSVVKMFLSTASGPADTNPSGWDATNLSPTSLAWDLPSDVPLGQGFATFSVVNTDQGYRESNLVARHVFGSAAAGLPTILTIGGAGLRAPDASLPGAHVETVLAAGSTVTIGGTGFSAPVVNLFTANGNAGPLTPLPGGTATSFQVVIPAGVPAGPGTFQVVNTGTGYKVSNAVDAVLRARITVTSVSVVGSTVNVVGDGFCGLTVINLFNVQGGDVVNLGGLSGGAPVIPLTVTDAQHMSFTLPAGAQSGPAYVQALNPPYTPYTSSGTDPGGAFTVP